VHDRIDFQSEAGGQLDVHSTLCKEVREAQHPVLIDQASLDPVYCDHHTPQLYKIESYVSVPIVLSNGEYFGNLCAIDPRPAKVKEPQILGMFTSFAQLIALQLEAERDSGSHRGGAARRTRGRRAARAVHRGARPRPAQPAGVDVGLRTAARSPSRRSGQGPRDRAPHRRQRPPHGRAAGRHPRPRARAARGGIGVLPAPVDDLDVALRAVVDELRDAHPQRVIDARIEVNTRVVCDRGRVQQLASNLLANALVHGSAAGPVSLEASTSDGSVVIDIANDGEPIPADSLAKVFAPFWRRSTSAAREGLGLGLYICAEIVKAHHGTLEVASTAETGTRFTARLPLEASRPAR
jgi:hypothetical protein